MPYLFGYGTVYPATSLTGQPVNKTPIKATNAASWLPVNINMLFLASKLCRRIMAADMKCAKIVTGTIATIKKIHVCQNIRVDINKIRNKKFALI